MTDLSHLHALMIGLSHENARLHDAKSDAEREMRRVWVRQYERQIADEYAFLGIESPKIDLDIPGDDLLAELAGP